MKTVLVLLFSLFLLHIESKAQTYANVPGPENVLVVYNSNSEVSDSVKNYYKDSRNIPSTNIVPLNELVSRAITVDGVTHRVIIAEGGNIIRDSIAHVGGYWFATQHAWKYFYQYFAEPIKQYLINNNLTETIRYIALCKGVPFKIQAAGDYGIGIGNISVDGLLCMLGTDNYETLLDSIWNKYRSYALPDSNYCYVCLPQISNPYYDADPNLNMNNRFKPGVFTRIWNGNTIKLDYLVSHLDGISYNMVKGMIDLSSEAIHSDNYDWFIDADPIPCFGGSIMVTFANSTASKLNSVGFTNYFFDISEDTVTYHSVPVMSYSSNGVHTTLGPYHDPNCQNFAFSPDYIQSSLHFDYAPGAIFNTAESFNCYLLSSISRITQMGQVVDFFVKGGTLGLGHAYEPFTFGIVNNSIMFPSYQVGYSFIDAAYMGTYYLAWQNVIVGDPLTTIAWGKQTLTQDITWQGTNFVTDTITIPLSKTLTITSAAIINLKHNGFITGDGKLVAPNNVTFKINDWQRGLFLAQENNHPKPFWGNHPSIPPTNGFNVYRKIDSGSWNLLAHTYNNYYLDEYVEITPPGGGVGNNFEYQITALINPLTESEYSNTVEINGDLKTRKLAGDNVTVDKFSYSLAQNYPNPFNPTTNISYSLKKAGLTTLKVFDILGKEVAILVNENQEAGNYSVKFSAKGGSASGGNVSNLPSGIYFYRIESGSFSSTKKLILLR